MFITTEVYTRYTAVTVKQASANPQGSLLKLSGQVCVSPILDVLKWCNILP